MADPALPSCTTELPEDFVVLSPEAGSDRASADFQNVQTIEALFHALRPEGDGTDCSPLSELHVPLGRTTIVTSATVGARDDRDDLVVDCQPAPGDRHRLARRLR